MIIALVSLCLVVCLCLFLQRRILLRLDHTILHVWTIAKQERDRDEQKAAAALAEATALKVASSTKALRKYVDEVVAGAGRQVAEADRRVRLAEQQLTDCVPVMEAGAALVRELRAVLDAMQPAGAVPITARTGTAPGDPDQRPTVEIAKPSTPSVGPAGDDPEELTAVATRPPTSVLNGLNGLRLASRPTIPPPEAGPASRQGGVQ